MSNPKPFTVAAWAEEFAGFYSFETIGEAEAFAQGWSSGAGNYGACKTTTYILPRDQTELEENPKDLIHVQAAMNKAK